MVTHYPAVRGMHKPVYFLDHRHKENASEDDSISRHNQFEVVRSPVQIPRCSQFL